MRYAATLLLLLAPCAASAFDPQDYLVARGEQVAMYLDPDAIKERDGALSAWIVTDRRTPKDDKQWSAKDLVAFDCANERSRYLSRIGYSQPGARGEVLSAENYDSGWDAVPPDTLMASIMQVVCAVAAGTPIEKVDNAHSHDLVEVMRENPEMFESYWWLDERYHAE